MSMRARVGAVVAAGVLMAACGSDQAMNQATDSGDEPPTQTERSDSGCQVPENVERVTDLRHSGDVGCEKAIEVAQAYDAEVMGGREFPGSDPVPAAGYSCRASQDGPASEETSRVACTGPGGDVSFEWGV